MQNKNRYKDYNNIQDKLLKQRKPKKKQKISGKSIFKLQQILKKDKSKEIKIDKKQ